MYQDPKAVQRLAESLMSLPSVGPKSAKRLAYHLLEAPREEVQELMASLQAIQTDVSQCPECGNYTEAQLCSVCQSEKRDRSIICVVAHARDVVAFEKTGTFRGLYHVLGGLISPMDGIGPDSLNLESLEKRVQSPGLKEIVLATDPTVAGEATAIFLEQIFEDFPGTVSRLALGIPVGSDFQYTDEVTLARALSYRQQLK